VPPGRPCGRLTPSVGGVAGARPEAVRRVVDGSPVRAPEPTASEVVRPGRASGSRRTGAGERRSRDGSQALGVTPGVYPAPLPRCE
jgi:hypothetical protein